MNNEQYEKAPNNAAVISEAESSKPITYSNKRYPAVEAFETPYEDVAYAKLVINEYGHHDYVAIGLNPKGDLKQSKIDYLLKNAGKKPLLDPRGVWSKTIKAIKRIDPDLRYLYMLDIIPLRTPNQETIGKKIISEMKDDALDANLKFIKWFIKKTSIRGILLSTGIPQFSKGLPKELSKEFKDKVRKMQQKIIDDNHPKIYFSMITITGGSFFCSFSQNTTKIISYADLVQGLQDECKIQSEETDLTDVDLKFEDGYIIYSDKEIRNKKIEINKDVQNIWNDDKAK